MIRFGLLGAGRIGEVHARNIAAHPRAELVAVSDPRRERAELIANVTHAAVRSVEEILGDSRVDAVLVASPTPLHSGQVVAAVRAKKPVLCEKPLSLSLKEARRCADQVDASGVPFMIALNKRFDPAIRDLKSRVGNGDLGAVELITLTAKDPEPPPGDYIATAGGIYRDMMIHDIDVGLFLSGELPAEVWAAGSALISQDFASANDFDTTAVLMRTASGILLVYTLSRRSPYGFDQRIEVHGERGTLRSRNVLESDVEFFGAAGSAGPLAQRSFIQRYAQAYKGELDAFILALEHDTPIALNVQHAIVIQTIADAVDHAAHTGSRVRVEYGGTA